MNSDGNILNALLIQYFPTPRDVKGNIKKIGEMIEKYTEEDKIDVVVLPEMALTGYIFDSKEDVTPYLEEYNKGETYEFCAKIAKRLKCYVFCGYPEADEDCLYNSCLIVNREGIPLPSYRKHFLYEMDKTWCVEGNQFGCLDIETHKGRKVKLGIGICMDLNPWEFKAPWDKMEFSTFCLEKNVDVILFLTNWLDNDPQKQTKKDVLQTINYWCMRLQPFLSDNIRYSNRNVYFLAANRCGKERDTNFIGSSCALKIENNQPILLSYLNKTDENTIFVSCDL